MLAVVYLLVWLIMPREVKGDDLDKKKYTGSPGWRFLARG
jgi:hypothetical protein